MIDGKAGAAGFLACKRRLTGENRLVVPGSRFRQATAGELPALVALDRLCFGRRAWSARAWTETVTDPGWTTLVAGEGGTIVAAMVLLLDRPVSSLASIAVHPGFRRRGLGRALLCEAERRARTAGALGLSLEVDRSNRSAVLLYRREGFGLLRRFREDGRWRLEMLRRLGRCRRA